MANTYQPADGTCTTLEENKKYVSLPPGTKGYLQEKVERGLKAPRIVSIKLPDGSTTDTFLKQVVVSSAIRVDENIADFRWMYKAEVSFDMWVTFLSGGRDAPMPFLSSGNKAEGPRRRHSLNPFPPGHKPGYLRRPDVIIVRNFAMRWPGRDSLDHDGAFHVDNLLRLVEIKFPGDGWGRGQEEAYQVIAGGMNRMSVLDVSDCDGELEKAKARARVPAPAPAPERDEKRDRLRAPIRSQSPIPSPVWYEDWIQDLEHARTEVARAISALWEDARRGVSQLSAEAQAWLRQQAPWLFEAGRWVRDASQNAWIWVNEQGERLYRFTAQQLRTAWAEIQRQTDLTWETLKQVQWGQLAMDVVKGLATVVLIIAGICVVAVVAVALVAALLALIAIVVEAGAAALAALALALGVGALAAA